MAVSEEDNCRTIKYGRNDLDIPDLLAGAKVISPPELPEIPDIDNDLRNVLDKPSGGPSLKEFVCEGDVVTIVVSDITRPVPTKAMLPAILENVSHAGQIRILVALGMHRKLTKEELLQVLGEKAAKSLPVFQHDAAAQARLIFLGRTRYGTEVQFSRFLMPEEAFREREDGSRKQKVKVILTGTIAPHYFFGFSGGRKSVLPGCASLYSISQNHSLALGPDGERVKECRAGNLVGNPCHLDSLEAARMIDNVFVINTVHAGAAEVAKITAGGLEKAHIEGCRFYLDKCAAKLDEKYDVVLASSGGYPRDLNFIQAHKAIEYAFHTLKPGGTLVIASECADGFGSEHFFRWFKHKRLEDFYKVLQNKYEVYGQTAYATLWKAKKVDIVLVSSIGPEKVRQMSLQPAGSLEEAAEIVRAKYGDNFNACLMPYAGDTLIRDESLRVE